MKYSIVKPEIYTGDVILWKGTGIVSQTIRLFSGGYSHASLVLRLDEFEGLKDRRFVLEAVHSGVGLNLLSNAMHDHGEAYLYQMKDEYTDKRNAIACWALGRVGTPYDFGGVFRNLFGYISADVKRLFCSEFVYLAYKEAGILNEQTAPRPGDITRWGCFKNPVRIDE